MYDIQPQWTELRSPDLVRQLPDAIQLGDHLCGIDSDGHNWILEVLDREAQRRQRPIWVSTGYIPLDHLCQRYQHLRLSLWPGPVYHQYLWRDFLQHRTSRSLEFTTLLCSFNGTDHVGRKLLTAALHRRGWFDHRYMTKNFSCDLDCLDGHISDLVPGQDRYWRKFFIGADTEPFLAREFTIDYHRFRHANNLRVLEPAVCASFVQLVSESMATSHEPYFTEKHLHSIVARGLFVAYAQPGWHHYLEQYLGFKLYRRVFDYTFDQEPNPVLRLVGLLDMLSRFASLGSDDWRDLYELEIDTIEHNHDWFCSGQLEQRLSTWYYPHE